VANSRMTGMVVSGLRRNGEILGLTLLLVLPIQSHRVTGVFMVVITSGHKVSNPRLVGHIQLYYILLTNSMVIYISVFVMREGTSASIMVSQGTCL